MKYTPIRFLATALMALAMVASPLALSGCSTLGIGNGDGPVIEAPTSPEFSLEQNVAVSLQAYATSAMYAADLVEDPATPTLAKTVLATAVLNTEVPARLLNEALGKYELAKLDIQNARTTGDADILTLTVSVAAQRLVDLSNLWSEFGSEITDFPGIVRANTTALPDDLRRVPLVMPDGVQIQLE